MRDKPDKGSASLSASFSAGATTTASSISIDPLAPETWKPHLTPDLRKHFENMGEATVQADVLRRAYQSDEKHFAALLWLGEQKKGRGRTNTRRFHLIFWVALAALAVAGIGIAVTKGWL